MSSEFNEINYSSKMDKSIQSLKKDLSTLRTGRANASMLDTIKVDVYGQQMPINEPVNQGYHPINHPYNTGTTPTNPPTYVANYINQEQTNYNPSHSVQDHLNHGVKYTGTYEHYQVSSGAQPFDLFILKGDKTSITQSYQNPQHVVQGNHYQPQNHMNLCTPQ